MARDNPMDPSRRRFLKRTTLLGGATATLNLDAQGSASAQSAWDQSADVVIVGAGASGLAAAITARDHGASVVVVDAHHDIGGHAMVSGGRIPLGGGTPQQLKYGIEDTADQVYLDHTNHANPEFRFGDRDLVRVWADENVATMNFLLANGVKFRDGRPTVTNGGTVPRLVITEVYSADLRETINGSPGSGLVRPLEASARRKGATFLLRHAMTGIVRETPSSGRVLGITARAGDRAVRIRATKGVLLCTGGHTGNVEFRRMFDPRLTAEYQTAGEPWTRQTADGELMAIAIGASLWGTAVQSNPSGMAITKTLHVGCRYGYANLKWNPQSPVFPLARASGLTVRNFQDVILVNRVGRRFWNALDSSYDFLSACLGSNGNLGKNGDRANGGGPIWAVFDADAVAREKWEPRPPHVDPDGWFFVADTLADLAHAISNPYQAAPMPAAALEETVARYNSFVDDGRDADFGKPSPAFRIQTPPFYAAWSTPILHDSLTGLRIDTRCRVLDVTGAVIPGLYAAGETAGGFGLHGLPRVLVFGRIAARAAATVSS